MKKTLILGMTLLTSMLLLAGCAEMDESISLENNTSAQIGADKDEVIAKSTEMKDLRIKHESETYGYKINTVYSVPVQLVEDWKFTYQMTVNLKFEVEELDPRYEITVNSVYSDVSILSKNLEWNGARQDSVFVQYGDLDSGGIAVDKGRPYTLPFQIEGINQNQQTVMFINGYGSSSVSRITESSIRQNAEGGRLGSVWTILIKDKETGRVFSDTISDTIGLKIKKQTND